MGQCQKSCSSQSDPFGLHSEAFLNSNRLQSVFSWIAIYTDIKQMSPSETQEEQNAWMGNFVFRISVRNLQNENYSGPTTAYNVHALQHYWNHTKHGWEASAR